MKQALAKHRIGAQRLTGDGAMLGSPAAVVGHFGAIQSQLPDMALWAIGRRCGATLAEVEASFARGDFVRTHVLRPTWHYVLPSDLPDLLAVTAPRIRQAMASNNRRDGLERDAIERWAARAVDIIRAHGPLSRLDVERHLAEDGFTRQGNSLAHVMIEAELSGAIHSGPVLGKQHSYIAADLPPSRRTPDQRLVWLAETYGRGHGPFRAKDLAWWTTLTLTQAREAIDLAGLDHVELAGEPHAVVDAVTDAEVPRALLLPNFDEYISYARDPEDYALVGGDVGTIMRATGLLFIDGALAGSWTRRMTASTVHLTVTTASRIPTPIGAEIEAEARRFGAFVERDANLELRVVHPAVNK